MPVPTVLRRFLRLLCWLLLALLLSYVALYLLHRPFRGATPAPVENFERMAHRGVHQTYSSEGLDNTTCTASRLDPLSHRLLENTPDSIRAAVEAGADRIEIDLQLSRDGVLMVFHDWTLDCRTEGRGETRAQTAAALKQLDIGYGYTADGGRTFPFRGQFVGAMPTLAEILDAFPDTHFLLDQKDPSQKLTQALIDLLKARGAQALGNVCLQSTEQRNAQFRAAFAINACTWPDRRTVQHCLFGYLAHPLAFAAPQSCAGQTLIVPDWRLSRVLWGWPGTFVERMHAAGARVLVLTDEPARAEHYRLLGFDGVWTNHIERWRDWR